MDNMKRSNKRLVTRLAILALVIVCGAIAIAQAQWNVWTTGQEPDLTEATISAVATNTEPDANSTAAIVDMQAANAWLQSDKPSANVPAAAVQVIHDNRVQPVQAEDDSYGSRFGPAHEIFPASENPSNPIRNSMNDEISDTAPAESFGVNPLAAPAPLNDGDTPAARLETPSTDVSLASEAQFADASDTGLADESQTEGEPDTSYFAEPDGFPSPLPNSATLPPQSVPEADGWGSETAADSYPADPRLDDSQSPSRYNTNPVRAGDQAFPSAPPEPIAREPSSLAEPDTTYEELPRHNDQQSFGDAPAYATADVPGSRNDITLAGVGRPGPRELEGPQSPSLIIRKIAPTNVRVGQPATFQIKVRNVGQVPADRVLVRDEIPMGTTLVDTTPQATATAEGAVLWQLGTLRPGDVETVSMQVTPMEEGPIGSVATLTFQALASARASATRPMLELEHSGPRQVLVGEQVNFTISLANPGSGDATQVVLQEDVPEGLSHSKGPQLEHEIGTIPAGATRRVQLSLTAANAGLVENVVVARADGGLVAEHRINLEVIAPDLRVRVTGPSRRYLERKTTFTLAIENPGTAPARNVELMTRLPQTLKFVSTNNSGRLDRTTNTIRWNLDRLPAGQFGEVKFTTVPTQMGDFNIHAEAKADMGLQAEQIHRLEVEGIAALLFGVADKVDPIEVGAITTYEIRVKNQGTKDAGNVRFVALIPPGLKAVDGSGPTNVRIEGAQVFCDPIARLPAKGESTYEIRVEGVEAGDQRFRVQMSSDETSVPVVKEESTRVYSD